MDYNTNTLLFTQLIEPEFKNKCDYCECICYFELKAWDCPGIKTNSFETFYKYIDDPKSGRSSDCIFYLEETASIIISKNNCYGCSCIDCEKGRKCEPVLKQIFDNELNKKRLACKACNTSNKYVCKCSKNILNYIIVWIPEVPIKTKPDDSIYTITIFDIGEKRYIKNNLDDMDENEKIDWFLNNVPIKTQFSINSSLNIYDELTREQLLTLTNILQNYEKSIHHRKKENFVIFDEKEVNKNKYFIGLTTVNNYFTAFNKLIKYYSDNTTLNKLETKINPHVGKKNKN